MNLQKTMAELYNSEISCGIESFWDNGFTAWIGDEMNGREEQAYFEPSELQLAAEWLDETARRLYPHSRYTNK